MIRLGTLSMTITLILLGCGAPALVSYAVAFSEPGTYSYKCLIHPAMGA